MCKLLNIISIYINCSFVKHHEPMNMGSYKSLYYYLLIIQIITLCFNVSPKLNASDAPVREQKYYLKTFDTKITSKAIALVYSFATQNDNITDIL